MDITVADVVRMRDGLRELLTAVGEFASGYDGVPTAEARAYTEEASSPVPSATAGIRAQCMHLMEVCGDHVSTLVKVLTEPVEVIAQWSSLRALVEASAIASWILDPNIDEGERARRGIRLRYTGMKKLRSFARATDDRSRIQHAESRLANVRQQAIKASITGAPEMPTSTDLVRDVLKEPWLYRLSSAVMHGHLWTMDLLYERDGAIHTPTGQRMHGMMKTAKPNMSAYVLVAAAEVFTRPVWYQWQYFGWDEAQLQRIMESGFDSMGLSDAKRFWRGRAG